jgi:actin-related protein
VDVRRELYSGIVLTGGTSMFSTLRDRLERELTEIAPQMAKVKVACLPSRGGWEKGAPPRGL